MAKSHSHKIWGRRQAWCADSIGVVILECVSSFAVSHVPTLAMHAC